MRRIILISLALLINNLDKDMLFQGVDVLFF